MSGSLDDYFGATLSQGDLASSYTFGAGANTVFRAGLTALVATFDAAADQAAAALLSVDLSNPPGVFAAVSAAGNLATAIVAKAELVTAQRAASRS